MTTYTLGSLFSGIGGIDLAFEWAGYETKWQVEIEDFPRQVLEKHWPGLLRPRDVRGCTGRTGKGWRRYQRLPRVDVMVGGFPCQPHSVAGKRLGEADSRNLWPDFKRLISDLRPRAVLLENVPGILATLGADVLADLTTMGYVGRAGIISAADAGAPHQRERWFVVAYAKGARLPQRGNRSEEDSRPTGKTTTHESKSRPARGRGNSRGSGHWYPKRGLGRGIDGFSAWLDESYTRWPAGPEQPQHAWEPPRVASNIPQRTHRLKALGNAVVPQVVYPLAVAIREWLQAQDANESADSMSGAA